LSTDFLHGSRLIQYILILLISPHSVKAGVEVCRDEDVKFTGKAEDDAAERRRTEVWAG